MSTHRAIQSAVILPFVRPLQVPNRLTMADRIAAMEWHAGKRAVGYTRIAFDTSASPEEPELGDFMLIYATDTKWAAWGIGCCDGGYIVWRPATGTTTAWHKGIASALASIPPA
ncbi:MAG: hypothetical protein NT133_18205 [Alphaproteobacteria bacterium]|nr:hypothetical protein [Alphaproteobacteria bacterium]